MQYTNGKRRVVPTPKAEIDAAPTFSCDKRVQIPQGVCLKPIQLLDYGNYRYGDCVTAEEAFAKTCCLETEISLTDQVVDAWAIEHGFQNGTYTLTEVMKAMMVKGFPWSHDPGAVANDGSYNSIDFEDFLQVAYAMAQGPHCIKLGVVSDLLWTAYINNKCQTGWCVVDIQIPIDPVNEDHCVSVSGYGPLGWLASLYGVTLPAEVDGDRFGFSIFSWGTIGFIDNYTLVSITAEAWVRVPTTVIIAPNGRHFPPDRMPKTKCEVITYPSLTAS